MNRKLLSLSLTAILATSFIAISKALAWTSGDPVLTRCDQSMHPIALQPGQESLSNLPLGISITLINDQSVVRLRKTLRIENDQPGSTPVWVELDYSSNCGSKWVTAQVPTGTHLYLQDSNGKHYVDTKSGTPDSSVTNDDESVIIWWTNMSDGSIQYEACTDLKSLGCTQLR